MKAKILCLVAFIAIFVSCNNKNEKTDTTEIIADSLMTEQQPDSVIEMGRIGIKMQKISGVYSLPALVNGVKMNFIFDTGASDVCISLTEARFLLKNGNLREDEITGSTYAKIADGSIVENTSIILREIEIEGFTIENVSARVVHTSTAPLLLGQSAIQKLGRVEFVGDSLYIIRQLKTKRGSLTIRDQVKVQKSRQSFIQKIKDWLGITEKYDEYIVKADEAMKNDVDVLAQKYLQQAIDEDASRWEAHYKMGKVIYNQNHNDSLALLHFEKALQLNKNKEDYENLLEAYSISIRKNSDYSKLVELSQLLLEVNPNSITAYENLVRYYNSKQEYDKAIKYSQKIIDIDSNNPRGYFYLAFNYGLQGRFSKQIYYYERALMLMPEASSTYYNLALCYLNKNRNYAIQLIKKGAELGDKKSQKWLKDNGYDW